jgi:hypothetical protein
VVSVVLPAGMFPRKQAAVVLLFCIAGYQDCVALAHLLFFHLPLVIFILVTILWGVMVAADSPQFSTLVAKTAIPDIQWNCADDCLRVSVLQLLLSASSLLTTCKTG